jgi:uncharacterized protein (DUF427 family)
VRVGDSVVENAVWGYPEPIDSAPPLADYLAFYWNKMDHWYEEDEEVFVHPRDPYHRVDVLKSSRHVKIFVDGEVVAVTDRPRILFETGLPPRYYFPLRKPLRMYCTLATRKRNVPTRGLRLTTRCRRAVRPG